MQILWKRSNDKTFFFARRNAELLLNINKTSSKVETASVPSSSKKCPFDFMPL